MQTVLITGANRGIGLELVKVFLERNWEVIACCRNPDHAQDLHEVLDTEPPMEIMPLDVCDEDSVAALAARLEGRPIDLLINNAGIIGDTAHQEPGDMNYESWRQLLETNTLAPARVLEALMVNLCAAPQPHCVNISSALASIELSNGYVPAYSCSKAALNALMKSWAEHLRDRGLRINLLSPGWVRTDMGGPDAALDPAESAALLHRNIMALGPEDSGRFISHDGQILPW